MALTECERLTNDLAGLVRRRGLTGRESFQAIANAAAICCLEIPLDDRAPHEIANVVYLTLLASLAFNTRDSAEDIDVTVELTRALAAKP